MGTGFEARGISVVRRLDASDLESKFTHLLRKSNAAWFERGGQPWDQTCTYETGTCLGGHKALQRSAASSATPVHHATRRRGRCKKHQEIRGKLCVWAGGRFTNEPSLLPDLRSAAPNLHTILCAVSWRTTRMPTNPSQKRESASPYRKSNRREQHGTVGSAGRHLVSSCGAYRSSRFEAEPLHVAAAPGGGVLEEEDIFFAFLRGGAFCVPGLPAAAAGCALCGDACAVRAALSCKAIFRCT